MRKNRPEHLYEQILTAVSESNVLPIIAKGTAQNYEKERCWETVNIWKTSKQTQKPKTKPQPKSPISTYYLSTYYSQYYLSCLTEGRIDGMLPEKLILQHFKFSSWWSFRTLTWLKFSLICARNLPDHNYSASNIVCIHPGVSFHSQKAGSLGTKEKKSVLSYIPVTNKEFIRTDRAVFDMMSKVDCHLIS